MIFVPFTSRIDDYTGFVYFLESNGNEYYVINGSHKQDVTREILDEGICVDEHTIRNIETKVKDPILYLNKGILYSGNKATFKNLYLNHEIVFNKNEVLLETEFVENVFDHKYSLSFINSHINDYKVVLEDEYESYDNYIFAHLSIPRFIDKLYDLYINNNLSYENVTSLLDEFNYNTDVMMKFTSINDYIYYLVSFKKDKKKLSFDRFKQITMHFLY